MPSVPNATYVKDVPLPVYIRRKIDMLRSDFLIHLTYEERAHFWELTTEQDVDNYAHSIIMKKL